MITRDISVRPGDRVRALTTDTSGTVVWVVRADNSRADLDHAEDFDGFAKVAWDDGGRGHICARAEGLDWRKVTP